MQAKFPLLNCLIAFFALTTLNSSVVLGQQDNPDGDIAREAKDLIKELVDLGPGVHEVGKNDDGRVVSFFVIGQAPISTVLGKAKGLDIARRKAELDCSAQVIKWLKQEASIYESRDDESVIVMEGNESEPSSSRTEVGKSIDKFSTKMESASSGIIRGLQLINATQDGKGKTYSVIKYWSLDASEATKRIAKSSRSDDESNSVENKKGSKNGGSSDDEIESKSTTSRALNEILKRRKK